MWQFRTRVPADLQGVLGRTHINRSLRTSSYPDAIRAARRVAFEIEDMFDTARGGTGGDPAHAACDRACLPPPAPSVTADSALPDPTGPAIHIDLDLLASRIAEKLQAAQQVDKEAALPTAAPAKAKTIQQVYDAYMADPGVIRSGKTILAYETVFGLLIEIIGQDTPVSDIGRETCREVMDTLRWLPPNSTKRYPNLTAREIAQKTRDAGKASGLSPATVNGYMTKLSALLTWAVNEGFIDRNPAKGLGVVDTTNRKDKRQPFTPKQLQGIFTAPLYTGCQDDDYGYAKPGDARPRRGRFWVPLIGLFSGMRLNEICQMNTEDVRVIDGTLCFVVTAEAIKGTDDKRLKTGSSERVIPVHPTLLAAGFEEYVSEQRRKRNAKLFPELLPAKPDITPMYSRSGSAASFRKQEHRQAGLAFIASATISATLSGRLGLTASLPWPLAVGPATTATWARKVPSSMAGGSGHRPFWRPSPKSATRNWTFLISRHGSFQNLCRRGKGPRLPPTLCR